MAGPVRASLQEAASEGGVEVRGRPRGRLGERAHPRVASPAGYLGWVLSARALSVIAIIMIIIIIIIVIVIVTLPMIMRLIVIIIVIIIMIVIVMIIKRIMT